MSASADEPSIPLPDERSPSGDTDPGTYADDDLLIELSDEFATRIRRGERVSVEDYAARHAALADRIRKAFPAIALMEAGRVGDFAPGGEMTGSTIGRYKLLERIGEGGFGVVYMAEQHQPVRRRVALKVIKPGMDTRQVLARFEAERQALAIMDHPNIAKVFDGGMTDSGRPYFVMELVRGQPITDYCDANHLAPRQRLELFAQVCHAVQHAHQKGVIHRDIKPANVLVIMHDTIPQVKVIDFGVAKALGQELTEKTLFTAFAQLVGTPLYMSPEQAGHSALDVDTRSDIYSLGVLLYELLTGTTPFDKERFRTAAHDEIRRIIREEEPPKPSTRLSESKGSLASISAQRQMEPVKLTKLIRGELDWIVMKALEKERTRRYETATGLARDIDRYLRDEPVEACPPSAAYRLRKFARRNKATLLTASVVGVALLFAVGILGWAARDRTARQAKVQGQVELILGEVHQLAREQKWPEALVAARRAAAVVASGDADAATERRVRAELKDLEFLELLEQIRMRQATWLAGKFDKAGADREYAQAFREYGVDVLALDPNRSIELLKTRPALVVRLAAALDSWLDAHWEVTRDSITSERLVAVARGIDPDPLRDGLRSAFGKPVSEMRDELRRLAQSIDVRAHQPATLNALASGLYRAKLPNLALRVYRDGQSTYPGDFWLNFNMAHALSEQEDKEGSVRFYTAAVAIRPQAVAALNNLGNVLRDQSKLDEAAIVYRKAIELDPAFATAYSNFGNLLGDMESAGAIAAYHKAIELDPANTHAYYNLGIALRREKKFEEAIAAYRKVIEIEPARAASHLAIGSIYCDELKEYGKAIECFRKAIELEPNNSNAYTNLAIALRKQVKPEDAIAALEKAVELDPQNHFAYHHLGSMLYEQKKFDEAIAAYTKRISIVPDEPYSYHNRAAAYSAIAQWDKAVADYEKQLQLNPTDHWPWYFRACILAYLDRKQEYGEHCRAMLVQFADNGNSGVIERTTKTALLLPGGVRETEDVTRRVESIYVMAPDSPWNMLLKGMADCRAGRYNEATVPLEKCRAVAPDDYFTRMGGVTADAFLAIARYRLGEVDEARAALNRATVQAAKVFPPVGTPAWSALNLDHWLIAQTALREAETLILERRATTAPKP